MINETDDRDRKDFEPTIISRRFVARRLSGCQPPLPKALLSVAHAISRELSIPPLQFAGLPARSIELSNDAFTQWLAAFEQFRRYETSKAFCLSDHPRKPSTILWLDVVESNPPVEQIFFVEPEHFPLDSLLSAIEQVCSEFGAFYGWTWDNLLDGLHGRGLRAYQIGIAHLSPNERQNVSPPEPIEGIPDTLPQLLLQCEFDNTYVPHGVWWINVWSRTQVETVGFESVVAGDWFRIIEQPDGGLILVLTEEPTDIRRFEHREKLEKILTHLRLGELQEQYRLST